MKNVFENIRAECVICGTLLHGKDIKRRGDNYYCESDYEKTSPDELIQNKFQEQRKKNYDKIFQR